MQDLRFIKIEESLRQAILELLQEKPFAKITVTDICKRAHCSRNAFYLHYESKEGLYDAIILDIVLDIEKSCLPVVENLSDIGITESEAYITNILIAVEKHRTILKNLLENEQVNFARTFKKIMIDSMITHSKTFNQETNKDYIYYFAGGISSFIDYWILETDYSLEEAKEKIIAITLNKPFPNQHGSLSAFYT